MAENKDQGNRPKIIRAVTTPLGFYALTLLVAEGILGILAARVDGGGQIVLIVGFLLSSHVVSCFSCTDVALVQARILKGHLLPASHGS